jgi:hypothetical protein
MFASEYLTTALGMPFEVGKTLLQVEYKPKPGVDDGQEVEGVDFEVEGEDESGEEDNEGEEGHGEGRRNRRRGHRDSIDAQVRGYCATWAASWTALTMSARNGAQ